MTIMSKHKFVVCVSNEGYEASLETRKLYESIPDVQAEKLAQVRVIDESGDDYLYPMALFEAIQLRAPLERKLLHVA